MSQPAPRGPLARQASIRDKLDEKLKANAGVPPPVWAPAKKKARGPSSLQAYFKGLMLGLVPPHIRRRGFVMPPVKDSLLRGLSMLSLPYFPWLRLDWGLYFRKFLAYDMLAGATVAVMAVPQGLAFGVMAGLPAVYGLYAATVAGYVYAIFGTSGQLTIGAVVLVSMFLGEVFQALGLNMSTKDKYATYVRCEVAPLLSLAVGTWLTLMALLRVGNLMRYVSPSVLTGFITGSGVYIFIGQTKYLFGIKVPHQHTNYEEFKLLFRRIPQANKYAMLIGFPAFGVLLLYTFARSAVKPRLAALRRRNAALANLAQVALSSTTLLVIIVATLVSRSFVKAGHKLSIVGVVPAGFNHFAPPAIVNDFGIPFSSIMVHALPLTFLTYMESVSVATKFANLNRYALDMTQELWALGLGTLCASFFQAYPPGGSFSRTALKAEIGVKTPFANVFTSLVLTLVLVCATKLLKFVPQAVLGAIMCSAVTVLFDFFEMWRALWVAPLDFVIMLLTFLVTVLWDVEKGLVLGLLASVIVLLIQISNLDVTQVGQILPDGPPGAGGSDRVKFRAMPSYPGAQSDDEVKILNLSANLFFGNVSVFRDEFYRSLALSQSKVRAVVVDASGVTSVDLSSLAVIDDLVHEVGRQDVRVFFAGASPRVIKALDSYDLLEAVGGENLSKLDVEDVYYAVVEVLEIHKEAAGEEDPLLWTDQLSELALASAEGEEEEVKVEVVELMERGGSGPQQAEQAAPRVKSVVQQTNETVYELAKQRSLRPQQAGGVAERGTVTRSRSLTWRDMEADHAPETTQELMQVVAEKARQESKHAEQV